MGAAPVLPQPRPRPAASPSKLSPAPFERPSPPFSLSHPPQKKTALRARSTHDASAASGAGGASRQLATRRICCVMTGGSAERRLSPSAQLSARMSCETRRRPDGAGSEGWRRGGAGPSLLACPSNPNVARQGRDAAGGRAGHRQQSGPPKKTPPLPSVRLQKRNPSTKRPTRREDALLVQVHQDGRGG